MAERISEVSADVIDDPATPMRTAMDEEKIQELMQSITRHGLIQPITLRKTGKRFEVVAGHRRFTACKRLRMLMIPAVVRELDDAKADEIRMAENLYREDVNPVDEARYIKKMVEQHAVEPAELAKMTGKSEAYLMARYDILEYPDYLIAALSAEAIGITAAQWLMRITDENIRREYTFFATSGGITANRARAWYESWNAGQLPRDPLSFVVPAGTGSGEPLKIYDTCVICRTRDEIGNMRMHYGHGNCVEEIARAVTHHANAN